MNDRISRYSWFFHFTFKMTQEVETPATALLKLFVTCVYTLTADNEKLFGQDARINLVMQRINQRPGKCLCFKTHHQVCMKQHQSHQ